MIQKNGHAAKTSNKINVAMNAQNRWSDDFKKDYYKQFDKPGFQGLTSQAQHTWQDFVKMQGGDLNQLKSNKYLPNDFSKPISASVVPSNRLSQKTFDFKVKMSMPMDDLENMRNKNQGIPKKNFEGKQNQEMQFKIDNTSKIGNESVL